MTQKIFSLQNITMGNQKTQNLMLIFKFVDTFPYFKCKCEKYCTFSNILQTVKSNFFANIYHSPFDSY
jgi:hypothetical protein